LSIRVGLDVLQLLPQQQIPPLLFEGFLLELSGQELDGVRLFPLWNPVLGPSLVGVSPVWGKPLLRELKEPPLILGGFFWRQVWAQFLWARSSRAVLFRVL